MSKAFVGIQVGAISFIDEGVGPTLDRFEQLGAVNALCISALSWSRGNAGRALGVFPDHGEQVPDNLQGGAFFKPSPRYYEGTRIRNFAAPDPLYQGFDTLRDVIPEAKKRGMAVYPYYCETAHAAPKPLWQPEFTHVLEVDAFGRVATRPCMRNPDYRAFWTSIISDWIGEHDIDGVMWGIERQSPLSALVEVEGDVPTCFCEHCRAEAARRGVDSQRAAEGYRAVAAYLDRARLGEERPPDGYLIGFMRLLGQYPEIAQWERLWADAHKGMYQHVSGVVRYHGARYQVGVGIWQMINTFNPYLRAQYDPAEYRSYADWVKPVLYNAPAGERFAGFVRRLCQTVLRDAGPEEWIPILYRILGLDEAAFEDLPAQGFSPEYVRRFTAKHVQALGPKVRVYPGIGVGVEAGAHGVRPDDVSAAVEAAFAGGAEGIVVSRNYSEMRLENLEAVGTTIRRLTPSS